MVLALNPNDRFGLNPNDLFELNRKNYGRIYRCCYKKQENAPAGDILLCVLIVDREGLSDDVHLVDKVLSVGVFVDDEEHVAAVEADAAL